MKRFLSMPPLNMDLVLLLTRVAIALMMLVHGIPKLQSLLSAEPVKFPPLLGMSASMSLTMAVFAEVGCSVLILLGLATRLAVIPLIITMLVAVFYIHGGDPFAKQELGLHYLLVYVVLLFMGSGRYSVDYFLNDKRS